MKMQRSTIKEYNEDYDAGIHNVIAFLFSQKPYRLQRIYENKHSLVERWQRENLLKRVILYHSQKQKWITYLNVKNHVLISMN